MPIPWTTEDTQHTAFILREQDPATEVLGVLGHAFRWQLGPIFALMLGELFDHAIPLGN